MDPDGNETYDSSITREQFEDISQGIRQTSNGYEVTVGRKTWDEAQQFFAENPNGVIYRNPDEVCYRFYTNKGKDRPQEYQMLTTTGVDLLLFGRGIYKAVGAGIMVSTNLGRGLTSAGIKKALCNPSRIQHASRHLIANGILPNWSKNTLELAKSLYSSILSNPEKTFEYVLKGGILCDGFSKTIDGKKIMVLIYKTGEFTGQIATSFVANQLQINTLGL